MYFSLNKLNLKQKDASIGFLRGFWETFVPLEEEGGKAEEGEGRGQGEREKEKATT